MKYATSSRRPPCDDDEICGITGFDILHRERAMQPGSMVSLVASVWLQVVNISPRQTFERFSEKQRRIYYAYTLDKLGEYLDSLNWKHYPLKGDEMYYLITKFHITYNAVLLNE